MAPQWWPDSTRRFSKRPFYERNEIEQIAVAQLRRITTQANITCNWPLSDDALELMAMDLTEEFDAFYDMSRLATPVDGYTRFSRSAKPIVRINQDLEQYAARRRMTIAHELGHVVLHQPLYASDDKQLDLLLPPPLVPVYCEKSQIVSSVDWCEWQAGYFAGVLLIPSVVVRAKLEELNPSFLTIKVDDDRSIINAAQLISSAFQVSNEAASVRLSQIGIIESAASLSLKTSTT